MSERITVSEETTQYLSEAVEDYMNDKKLKLSEKELASVENFYGGKVLTAIHSWPHYSVSFKQYININNKMKSFYTNARKYEERRIDEINKLKEEETDYACERGGQLFVITGDKE